MLVPPGGIVGNAGGPYKTFKGAVDVHLADLHEIPVNDYVHRHDLTIQTTLTAQANAGDTQLAVASITGFALGDLLHIGDPGGGATESTHPAITVAPTGSTLVLDGPLDNTYLAGTTITKAVANMASLAGTLAAPISYKYWPAPGQVEHIKRILLSILSPTQPDDGTFGDQAALTNGVVFRVVKNGVTGKFTNWKTNGDIRLDVYDVSYAQKSGGGSWGTSARGSFSRLDVAPVLDSATGDYLEVLIQDTLTATDFRLKIQGHIEGQ